ncbi:MAG TPA: deoxyribodipyrimidine photo-lyase, partial [Flavisolibacter sp.]|nr:deoxyribodipyrimidine photo-lyase [Flavisolibacter sp.]
AYSMFTPYSKKWKALLKKTDPNSYPAINRQSNFYKQAALPIPSLDQIGFVFNKNIISIPSVDQTIIRHYHQTRDTPSLPGTTRLGVHLRFGTVSVRKLVSEAIQLNEVFLNELIWREFFMQMLWHQPRLVNEACKKEYDNIQWRNNEDEFKRWCNGQTGYPIVDAGMSELNETGFMHNRVRMIAASFLVKDLLIDWRWGEAYFARKLFDYELASNNGNWQWVAGCGCDAAPYFRVFNPSIQAKKFDPKGFYTNKWLPEFKTTSYPKPVVNHEQAKQRCIEAYKVALNKNRLAAMQ